MLEKEFNPCSLWTSQRVVLDLETKLTGFILESETNVDGKNLLT